MADRTQRQLAEKLAKKERGLIADACLDLRRRADAAHRQHHRVVVGGLSLIYSIGFLDEARQAFPDGCHQGCGEDHDHHHFSIRPMPVGRAMGDEDWINVGIACEAIGAPKETEALIEPQCKHDPGLERHALHLWWRIDRVFH